MSDVEDTAYPPLEISADRANELREMVARELGIDAERVCIGIALTRECCGGEE